MKDQILAVVLGLSPNIMQYSEDMKVLPPHIKIGVNDIFKHTPVDYLIVVDRKNRFTSKRKKIIEESRPKELLTFISEWKTHPCAKEIILATGRSNLGELDNPNVYPYSIMSPFIAMVHAYKLGAKTILVYGVDLNDHHALSDENCLNIIKRDVNNLNKEFNKRGVKMYIMNKESVLYGILPFYILPR